MKKIYLSALLIGLTSFGASAQYAVQQAFKLGVATQSVAPPVASTNTPKMVVWGEDFANGLNSPTNGTWTTDGANGNIWKRTTVTSTGQYANPAGVFGSSSAANGFMIFDADSANPGAASAFTNKTGSLISPVIDLTGEATARLNLEQDYRWCCTGTHKITVAVTSDAGLTWSPELDLTVGFVPSPNNSGQQADVANNGYNYSVNITQYAAGNNVQLRFTWDGIASGSSHYFWMLDDITIDQVPANELELSKSWHGDIVNDWEYSMFPLSQAREMFAGVVIVNNGSSDETPAITCVIHDANGVVATPAPISTLIPIGVTDTIWFNTGFTPSANGVYHAEFSIPADFDPSNNTSTTSTLTINDNLMAHDYGSTSTFGWSHTSTNTNIVAYADALHSWGEIYSPTVTQDVYGMDIWIGTGTTVGNYLLAQVYQIDPNNDGSWIQGPLSTVLAQVDINVVASDVNALKKITFPAPVQMVAGANYIFEVQKADGTTGSSFFIAGTSSNGEDDDNAAVGYGDYSATAGNVTYFNGWDRAHYIRPNFQNTAGLVETSIAGISIYPNPTEGKLTVTNTNNYNNTIEVVNVAGKVIYNGTSNKTEELNLNGNGAGVYFVTITNEFGSITEKVILK